MGALAKNWAKLSSRQASWKPFHGFQELTKWHLSLSIIFPHVIIAITCGDIHSGGAFQPLPSIIRERRMGGYIPPHPLPASVALGIWFRGRPNKQNIELNHIAQYSACYIALGTEFRGRSKELKDERVAHPSAPALYQRWSLVQSRSNIFLGRPRAQPYFFHAIKILRHW